MRGGTTTLCFLVRDVSVLLTMYITPTPYTGFLPDQYGTHNLLDDLWPAKRCNLLLQSRV
jgi:hypothetical protein